MFTVWFGPQNHQGVDGWVGGIYERGEGRGKRREKGAILHVEHHPVSLSVRCMLVPNSKNLYEEFNL